jgi:hypothetical protein
MASDSEVRAHDSDRANGGISPDLGVRARSHVAAEALPARRGHV